MRPLPVEIDPRQAGERLRAACPACRDRGPCTPPCERCVRAALALWRRRHAAALAANETTERRQGA